MVVKIGARKLMVLEVPLAIATDFLDEHHRQGSVAVATKLVSLGLYLEGNLLALAQFCAPRTEGKKRIYTTELLRLAFKTDYRIMGGASKLVNHYRVNYRPADLFTYQDMQGEATRVYEHCGFTLVSQPKKKEYLVAPGVTLATATRQEALSMAYATRFGPDRITGSSLGEVIGPDGKRKSNRELFIEELGWHVELTPGDRVYEWVDPNRTYYVYRITATDSDSYYIGVSHLRKANATADDCLAHNYYGSGSAKNETNKFTVWKKDHGTKLQKAVIGIYGRKAEAYAREKAEIGDLWSSDELCLNSMAGGAGSRAAIPRALITIKNCEIHGESSFIGDTCYRCAFAATWHEDHCEIHGLGTHQGDLCARCRAESLFQELLCSDHGWVAHRGLKCEACSYQAKLRQADCELHGITTHRFETCLRCMIIESLEELNCKFHGLTLHRGNTCLRCAAIDRVSVGQCSKHGKTKFLDSQCATCRALASITSQDCVKHGETKHVGSTCYRCMNEKSTTVAHCRKHGDSKHQGGKCLGCEADKQFHMTDCEHHGFSKFRKTSCLRCAAEKSAHTKKHDTLQVDCRYCSVIQ